MFFSCTLGPRVLASETMGFRKLDKVLGYTYTSRKVNTPIKYAGGLDES